MTRHRRTALSASLVAALAAAVLTAPSAKAPGGGDQSAAGSVEQRQESVTLITGDRVTVVGGARVADFRPGEGRGGIEAAIRRVDGHTYVIPRDAVGPLRSGRVDRSLFDVSRLAAAGYDDAHRTDLPLIVAYADRGARARAVAPLRVADARVHRSLRSIDADAISVRKSRTAGVWEALTEQRAAGVRQLAPGVAKVWLDRRLHAALDESAPRIGAPVAWQAGYDGTGVTVAVLDSGVDETHRDLAGREVAERNFSTTPDTRDVYGHGTHVASIAVGSGALSDGRYRGVASGAQYLDGKVLDNNGEADMSSVIDGIEWAVEQNADIVNLSLAFPDTPETDPLEEAVDRLSAETGTLFVASARNDQPNSWDISSPASAESALAVGSIWEGEQAEQSADKLPPNRLKPDVLAPGVEIAAAKSGNSQNGTPVRDGYVAMSGTSMAAAHATGAAALLAQQHPAWTGQRLKAALMTASDEGNLDVGRAVTQTVTAEPPVLDYGVHRWPHEDDVPIAKTVTFRNDGDDPVTLHLTVERNNAPPGTFRVELASLTVPAHGTAETTAVTDTRPGDYEDFGMLWGVLEATGGGQHLRVTMVVERERESYDLTLRHVDRNGEATGDYFTWLQDGWTLLQPYDADGTVTIRLIGTVLALGSTVWTHGTDRVTTSHLVHPVIRLDRDLTIDLDARLAKPFHVTVPDRAAKQVLALVGYQSYGENDGEAWWRTTFDGFYSAHLGGARSDGFKAQVMGVWQRQADDGTHVRYRLAYKKYNFLFTGFSHDAEASELTKLTLRLGAAVPGRTGRLTLTPVYESWTDAFSAVTHQPVPSTAVEYLNTKPRWRVEYGQYTEGRLPEFGYTLAPTAYEAGKSYTARLHTAVIGPTLHKEGAGVFRNGDRLHIRLPLFADSGNHRWSWGTFQSAHTALYRDGVQIWDGDRAPRVDLEVPPEKAAYKLTTDAYRDPDSTGISSRVTAAWTFTSGHVPAEEPAQLPVSALRFTPKLSLAGTDRAGSSLTVPFTVQGAAAGTGMEKVTIKASFDGGQTWKTATIVDGHHVTLHNPAKAGPVALRATVTDKAGNSLTQTIYRAYLTR